MTEPAAELGNQPPLLGSIGIVAEALPEAIVAADEDGRIVLVNAAAERLLGWPRTEIVGSTVERLVPTRLRIRHVRHRARYHRAAASRPMGRDMQLAVVTSGGAELPVDISLMPIRSAEGRYTLATIRDLRERRDAEHKLAESETRFRAVFEHATFGMAVLDARGQVVQANGALADMVGHTEQELLGKSARTLVVPVDASRLTAAVSALVSGEVELAEEAVQLLRHDDSTVEAYASLASIRAGVAPPSAVLLQVREVDEATHARARLAVAEANYRRLIEEIPLVTYVQGCDGTFAYVSPQIEELLGYPAERWVAGPGLYENALHPDDRDAVLSRRAADVRRGEAEESDYRLVGRDGRVVWVHDKATFEFDDDGLPVSRRGFLLDVTESRLAETALSESEQQLSLVFDGVSDLLFLIHVEPGPTYRWLAVNDAFRDATGLADTQIVGKRVEEILQPDEARLALLRYEETAASPASTWYHETLRAADGRLVDVETRLTPVVDADGRCTHLLGASRDVSDRQLLESRLREAEKLQAVGRLAGGIAHDFNNLLTVVALAGEQLHAQLTGAQRRDAEQIVEAAGRGAALTRQLLAFSRRQVLQPTYLDLNEIVSGMDAMLRRLIPEDVELVTSLTAGPGSVSADRSQLEQVIVNLVVNARDAMPRGGRLSIGTATVDLDGAAAGRVGVEPGTYVRLWVGDTGIGMDEELRSSIFEPYFTTKGADGGSGLGLATVHGIVHQSGGAIEIESARGEGTTFSVYLRLAERPPERTRGVSNGEHATGSGTILLVEDEEPVRRLAERALGAAGYALTTAASGSEALELAARRPAGFDLVITDVVMPGMSGPEFAERLRATHPSTRLLYISGHADDMLTEHGVAVDRIRLLEKPFTGAALAATVHAVLEEDRD